jgi:hypothetical protein
VFQRGSDVEGIDITLGRSSKLDTLLEVYSRTPGWKEIHNRWHSASIAFPVIVAEATLTK